MQVASNPTKADLNKNSETPLSPIVASRLKEAPTLTRVLLQKATDPESTALLHSRLELFLPVQADTKAAPEDEETEQGSSQ